MKFSSLEEYFYKLQNILLMLLLIPLLAFIYLIVGDVTPYSFQDDVQFIVTGLCAVIATADWIIMTVVSKRLMNKISLLMGLSLKLERYYYATLVRYSVGVASCLVLAMGYYLTENSFFIGLFGVAIVLSFITWPTPAKVCKDLKLKGDEREMVLYKKHSL